MLEKASQRRHQQYFDGHEKAVGTWYLQYHTSVGVTERTRCRVYQKSWGMNSCRSGGSADVVTRTRDMPRGHGDTNQNGGFG